MWSSFGKAAIKKFAFEAAPLTLKDILSSLTSSQPPPQQD